MDLIFTGKPFTVSIFLCRGREVESEKLFGLDVWLAKTTLWGGAGLGEQVYVQQQCRALNEIYMVLFLLLKTLKFTQNAVKLLVFLKC